MEVTPAHLSELSRFTPVAALIHPSAPMASPPGWAASLPLPWDSLNLGANRGGRPGTGGGEFPPLLLCGGADPAALVKNHQVHGDLVRPVTRRDVMSSSAEPGVYEADGLITDEPGLCLTIFPPTASPCCCWTRCAAALLLSTPAGGDRPGHRSPGRPPDAGGLRLPPGTYPGRHRAWDLPPAAF